MPDKNMEPMTLTARPVLETDGIQHERFSLTEHAVSLVSLAFSRSDRDAVSDRLKERLGASLPAVGSSEVTGATGRLLGLQIDQAWYTDADASFGAEQRLAARLGLDAACWLTDQSDAWASFKLSGDDTLSILERLFPLDLHAEVFANGSVVRTVMEHTGVIVLRLDKLAFEIYTPRSSANSLVHAIEVVSTHVHHEHALTSSPSAHQ